MMLASASIGSAALVADHIYEVNITPVILTLHYIMPALDATAALSSGLSARRQISVRAGKHPIVSSTPHNTVASGPAVPQVKA